MAPLQVRGFKKDVIYLFQFAGTPTVSSMSPYCVKVEAFCRLHKLNVERRNTFSARGANGLLPFIELNGEQICESQIFQKLSDPHSDALEHAVMRMIENHTIHLLRFDANRTLPVFIRTIMGDRVPGFTLPAVASLGSYYLRKKTKSGLKSAIGNFTNAEFDDMLRHDLVQLQNVLGGKQFLMDDVPTEADCIALAHIGHAYYRMPQARHFYPLLRSHIHELIDSTEFATLKDYFERVVKTLFGDEFKDKE